MRATPEVEMQISFIKIMLRDIRLAEGLRQDGLVNHGISRRMVQRAESGHTLSLVRLLMLLQQYGYTLKDLDWNDD